MNHRLRFSGTYTIRVEGCGTTGSFAIELRRKPDPQLLAPGDLAFGEVPIHRDYVPFNFTAAAGNTVTIHAAGVAGGLLPILRVIDPSGAEEVATHVSRCTPDAEIADHKIRFSGTYTIRVEGACGSTGDFELRLSAPSAEPTNTAQATSSVPSMVLPAGRIAMVTLTDRTGNCSGDFRLDSPTQVPLFPDYRQGAEGTSLEFGPFPQDEALVFALEPHDFCGPNTYLSTDPARARITVLDGGRWSIAWEDWNDRSFNDIVFTIEVR